TPPCKARSLAAEVVSVRTLFASLLAVAAVSAVPASAAEVTDTPPSLRGSARVHYAGAYFSGPLLEGGERVVGARRQQHGLDFDLAFSVTDGLAVTAALETAPVNVVSFTNNGREMMYDPIKNTGTYEGGATLTETPRYQAGGVIGVWLGVAVGPYGR